MRFWFPKRAGTPVTHPDEGESATKSLFIPDEGERIVVIGPSFEPREGVVSKLQIGVSGNSRPNRRGGMDYMESTFGWLQIRMDGNEVDSDFLPSGDAALPWTAIMHNGDGAHKVSIKAVG